MYGQQYTVVAPLTATHATNPTDLFEITAATNKVIVITSLYVGQDDDYGDAAAEGVKIQIIKGYTTTGSGGAAVTATPLQAGFAAFGGTVEAHNTTVATTGTGLVLHEDGFNIQIGYQWRPAPHEYIVITAASTERVVVRITGQADSLNLAGTLNFTVLG